MRLRSVAVIGLGQVGREVALAVSGAGHTVVGIEAYQSLSEIEIPGVLVSSDISIIKNSEIIIICVQTPLTEDGKPDLSFLLNAIDEVRNNSDESTIVVIESTVPVGTTASIVDILQRRTAFSPERIDPGNPISIKEIPKIVSSNDPLILEEVSEFYSTFIDNIVPCQNTDEAEAAKLLENAYRLINVSFINEFHSLMDLLRIDTSNVISLAATKPFGFQAFWPGLGAGGHCIPVDPIFLKSHDAETPLLDQAIKINEETAAIDNARMITEHMHDDIKDKKIVVLGVGYKSGQGDIRNSKAITLIKELKRLGADVYWSDELVSDIPGEKRLDDFSDVDLVVINNPENAFDINSIDGINRFIVGKINYFYNE